MPGPTGRNPSAQANGLGVILSSGIAVLKSFILFATMAALYFHHRQLLVSCLIQEFVFMRNKLGIIFVLAVLAVECSAESNSKPFKVALVTPGAINDGGWSQNAYMGLKRIESELGATIAKNVAATPNEAFAAFRDYADQGTNLIIGHASEWFDPKTLEIAADHPKTTILISGQNAKDNVVGLRFVLEDGCYILGQISASMSKTGILGCVGPEQVPVISSTFYAFEQGAKSVRPDIKVLTQWTKDSKDIARAKEVTLVLLGQGVDFIFQNANDGARGVFEAVKEKKDAGAYVFGSNADQSSMAPEVIPASVVLDIPSAFLSFAKKVKEGNAQKGVQFVGMPEGAVTVVYNKKIEGKIPADVRKLADDTIEKIKRRELSVPRLDLK